MFLKSFCSEMGSNNIVVLMSNRVVNNKFGLWLPFWVSFPLIYLSGWSLHSPLFLFMADNHGFGFFFGIPVDKNGTGHCLHLFGFADRTWAKYFSNTWFFEVNDLKRYKTLVVKLETEMNAYSCMAGTWHTSMGIYIDT